MKIERREVVEIVGITAVVVSLMFVGYELRQTQKSMLAESSTVRTQMAIDRSMAKFNWGSISEKVRNGDSLSDEEFEAAETRNSVFLRYVENLQYQRELGLLDEEIWNSNLHGLRGTVNSPAFQLTHPRFFTDQAFMFRASFVDLARTLLETQ